MNKSDFNIEESDKIVEANGECVVINDEIA